MYGVEGNLESNLSQFFSSIYKVIITDIFHIQLLAILGTGLSGVMLFLLIMISLVLFLIPIFEFVVVYIMAFVFVSVLMSLAPIFLVFMLFEKTKYLFENWVRFTLIYIFEPVIMFLGISLLTKMFLVYIDYVLAFSVCWKCVMSFQIPFLDQFPGFTFLKDLQTMPIFCIYWLAPWGYDPLNYNFATNLTNIVALFIISFTTLRYASLSSQICQRIFGSTTKSSITSSVSSAVSIAAVSGLQALKAREKPKQEEQEQAGVNKEDKKGESSKPKEESEEGKKDDRSKPKEEHKKDIRR
jgi:type IV secretion system protein VirB6